MMSLPCKNWDGKHKSLSESRELKNFKLFFSIPDSHLMICASCPNFYKSSSSLSEIFLPVSLNDLCFLSQFLQHDLIIKWDMPHMPFFMIVWSAPIFIDAAAIGWKFHVRGHMPALHSWRIPWCLQSGCTQLACTFGADLSASS